MARLGGRYGISEQYGTGRNRDSAIEAAIGNEEFARKVLSSYIIGRFGELDDAANLVLFQLLPELRVGSPGRPSPSMADTP
jgi:2-hydroxycyclohexanecarboxyl-CoA dehydrogenase